MHYINYSVRSRRLIYYRWRCSRCNEINTGQYSVTSKNTYFTPGHSVKQSNFDMLKEQGTNAINLKVLFMNFGKKCFKVGKVSGCCHHCGNVEPWANEFKYKKAIGVLSLLFAIIGFIAACYIVYIYDVKLGLLLALFSIFPLLIYCSEKKNTAKERTAALPLESIPIQVYELGFGKLGTEQEIIQIKIDELEKQKNERLQRETQHSEKTPSEPSTQAIASFLEASKDCVRFSEVLSNWRKLGLDQNERYDNITKVLISKNDIERFYGVDSVSVQKFLTETEKSYFNI